MAAQKGHVSVIHAIIARGENVNTRTNQGHTPLHLAVEAGNAEVVECLLGHGADVHLGGGAGQESPLHAACRRGNTRGGEKCARMLLKSGANPNCPMKDGKTPLHIVATGSNMGGGGGGALRVLRLLLENGADVEMKDDSGETALHAAIKNCHFSALRVK